MDMNVLSVYRINLFSYLNDKSPPYCDIHFVERASISFSYLIFIKKIILNLFQIILNLIENLEFFSQILNHCLVVFFPFFLLFYIESYINDSILNIDQI